MGSAFAVREFADSSGRMVHSLLITNKTGWKEVVHPLETHYGGPLINSNVCVFMQYQPNAEGRRRLLALHASGRLVDLGLLIPGVDSGKQKILGIQGASTNVVFIAVKSSNEESSVFPMSITKLHSAITNLPSISTELKRSE